MHGPAQSGTPRLAARVTRTVPALVPTSVFRTPAVRSAGQPDDPGAPTAGFAKHTPAGPPCHFAKPYPPPARQRGSGQPCRGSPVSRSTRLQDPSPDFAKPRHLPSLGERMRAGAGFREVDPSWVSGSTSRNRSLGGKSPGKEGFAKWEGDRFAPYGPAEASSFAKCTSLVSCRRLRETEACPKHGKQAHARVGFREVGVGARHWRRLPGEGPQFREVQLSRIIGLTSRNRSLAGARERACRRRSGFAKWRRFPSCRGRPRGDGPSFAKCCSLQISTRLRETGVWPEPGREPADGGRVSRSGDGSRPAADGSAARDPVSRSARLLCPVAGFAKPKHVRSMGSRRMRGSGFAKWSGGTPLETPAGQGTQFREVLLPSDTDSTSRNRSLAGARERGC